MIATELIEVENYENLTACINTAQKILESMHKYKDSESSLISMMGRLNAVIGLINHAITGHMQWQINKIILGRPT